MREAVIVSTARTPIGAAFTGSLNDTKSPTLMGHAIRHAVDRSGVDPRAIEDVVVGTALPGGTAGGNLARFAVLASGLPVTVPGQTVDRQCSSGLVAIATAANQIVLDGMEACVAGGQDNLSAVQSEYFAAVVREADTLAVHHMQHAYMPMVYAAEHFAQKFGVTRKAQDSYSVESQRRAILAQEMGRMSAEIVPIRTRMKVADARTGEFTWREAILAVDEGTRPDATAEHLARLQPVLEGGSVTAGNASQLSDGASACVMAEATYSERHGLRPMGIYRGMALAACAPMDMGLGPVDAIPRLLKRNGLRIEDIGLWELNEGFACQVLHCRDKLGIDPSICNVNGGAISLGHPYGMTGARMVGHALIEGKRRGVRFVVVSTSAAGGMSAAGLFEVV